MVLTLKCFDVIEYGYYGPYATTYKNITETDRQFLDENGIVGEDFYPLLNGSRLCIYCENKLTHKKCPEKHLARVDIVVNHLVEIQ